MAHFQQADQAMSCRYQQKHTHGGNHAPSPSDWFRNDDTLDRQGISPGKPNGHGICKGTASSWVIAYLNKVKDATDPALYEAYYRDFLRYQATMVKDFGKHIDSHVAQFSKLGIATHVKQKEQFQAVTLTRSKVPFGRWAAYMSVWHHDIAIGGTFGSIGNLYIVEPNTGLLGYKKWSHFTADLHAYLDHRRNSKGKPLTTPAGFWMYKAD